MNTNKKYTKASEIFNSLPPECTDNLSPLIARGREKISKTIVVLDDDPTGTQTVHDVDVLTDWSV